MRRERARQATGARMQFDDTMTEADFRRPSLDQDEERAFASSRREPDLAVDGLEASFMSRLLGLFMRDRR